MNYKITRQNDISVVTFLGGIERGDKDLILKCCEDVLSHNVRSVVLFFKEVDSIDALALRDLTLLQHHIRQKNIRIRLTVINNNIRSFLIEKGIVRNGELNNSISEAIMAASRVS